MTPHPIPQTRPTTTRDRIMDSLADLIVGEGLHDFSVQQVADRAGVSHRTVYRHYPSRQALLEALVDWLDERFAERLGSERAVLGDLPGSLVRNFTLMDEFARHVQAYVRLAWDTGKARASRRRRTKAIRELMRKGPTRRLDPHRQAAIAAVVYALASTRCWYQLTHDCGLDGRTAGETVGWALKVLFTALEKGDAPPAGGTLSETTT